MHYDKTSPIGPIMDRSAAGRRQAIPRRVAPALLFVALVAISWTVASSSTRYTTWKDGLRASLHARVIDVFQHQSRVADELLDQYPLREQFLAADPHLVAAERRMNQNCSAVAASAVKTVEGEAPSWLEHFRLARHLEPCDEAASKVELLLAAAMRSAVADGAATPR